MMISGLYPCDLFEKNFKSMLFQRQHGFDWNSKLRNCTGLRFCSYRVFNDGYFL